MRFQVPQYIEVEDKIFGPLTLKQFIYLAGAGGLVVISFSILPKFLAILVSLPLVTLGVALAFLRVNNQPFINVLESLFKYYVGGRLYIWKKEEKRVIKSQIDKVAGPEIYVPRMGDSKLKDLTWSLGVKKEESLEGENVQK